MFLLMALICAPLICVTAPNAAACLRAYASPPACGFLAILVFFCTLISYTMMNRWQKFVTATEAGLIYSIEPVIASLLSLFLPAIFRSGRPSTTPTRIDPAPVHRRRIDHGGEPIVAIEMAGGKRRES